MNETNSGVASPEAEENFNIGTAARTRPLSFEEIIERRKNKSEIVDSPKKTSMSTDFDNVSVYEPPSRNVTQGFRLASMVVSSKAEEQFESKDRDRDSDTVREGARNDGPTLKRSDMRKNNRYEEPREKRRRSTSRERHEKERERERERESHLRERNRPDPPPERRFDRREMPPERRINRKDMPPTRSPDRKADRRDHHPARSPEKRSDKRNLPSSPKRKLDRMNRPSSHSPKRKSSKQDHPHSHSPGKRPDKPDLPHRRPRSRSPEMKSDRLGHPYSRSQEKKSDKQDRVISHALERRSDKRDQPHRTPERRPEKRDRARSRSPPRRPEKRDRPRSRSPPRRLEKRDRPRSRSPQKRPEKGDRPRSRSPQKRPEKGDRPHSHSPQKRSEKRSRPRSRSPRRRPEQDRLRSRSPERRPNKHDRATSRSPERRSDKREQHHSHSPGRKSDKRDRSPERKSGKWDQPEKKLEKLAQQDRESIVDNSSSKQDPENKTEKPHISSVEKKSDKWDKPPAGVSITDQPGFGSILGVFQTTIQNMLETGTKSIMVEPAQLTQATRPRRRLYIENIPDLASEKTLIDEINTFFPETNPCLTCIINKEKRQALVEFLTPDDATKALSFDGRLFLGTALRIRRPKDYVEMPNVVPEKPVEEIKVISDIVKDSCHKIFVAGINSQLLSSKELMEIVSVWGPLKAYRFMYSEDLGEPCAFLEYEDHSITLSACAGLNGMRIGTRAITVVQALPDASDEPLDETSPSYDVPLHAKSLLADATPILQLKNMYDRDIFLQLSKTEVEEDIEDIRLTCARFGTVKSVKIVPYIKSTVPKDPNGTTIIAKDTGMDDTYETLENGPDETQNANSSPIGSSIGDEQINSVGQGPDAEEESTEQEKGSVSEISKKREQDAGFDASNGETTHNGDVPNGVETEDRDGDGDSEDIFVAGSVLIEFVRKEAACMAAHELHGELFGCQVMEAGFAHLELFLERFSK
ncbi:RNA-binding (RRM/RBD/RNP motifs) family protein [Carex rostrata]